MKQIHLPFRFVVFCCVTSLLTGLSSADVIVFSSDFESGVPPEVSGPGFADAVQGFAGIGNSGNTFGGSFLRNSSSGNPATPTTLQLTNLPSHTCVNVQFLLAILESWDGGGDVPGAAPDKLVVRVDGTTIFEESFETTGVSAQSYDPPPGVELIHKVHLGNWGHSYPESGYDMGLDPVFNNIPHTSDTLTIEWYAVGAGWQGGNDESWAIDNVLITLDGAATVDADSFNTFRGLQIGGDLSDSFESDDSYLKFHPGFTINSAEPPVWVEFEGTLPSDNPTSLSTTLEAQASTVGLTQTIEMFNWNSGQYQQVDTGAASWNNDAVVTVDVTADIADYVAAGSGAVKTRVGWKQTGLILNFPWTICIDQVVWNVTQ